MKEYGDVIFSVVVHFDDPLASGRYDIDYDRDALPDGLTDDFLALSDELWGICDEVLYRQPAGDYLVTLTGCFLDVDHEYGEAGEVLWSYPILSYKGFIVQEWTQ